jgi:hypothetical protein
MKRVLIGLTLLMFLQGCTLFGIRNYEILSYNVLIEEGNFQVRQYQDYVVAAATTEGSYEDNTDEGHDLLFDYISGENAGKQKIAMTAPVIQKSEGKKIAMTAPVLQKKSGSKWTMSFVLPSDYTVENAPQPLDSRVVIQKTTGKKVAVITYNGGLGEESITENTSKLMEWVNQKGFTVIEPSYSAGYDPPWTLPWLKRNEILVEIN